MDEVLDGADYFNRAAISKAELEHGVRDLMSAGLIRIDGTMSMVTEAGRALWQECWRSYEQEYARTQREDPIAVVEKRLRDLACAASSLSWSVTEREWETAVAKYRGWHQEAHDDNERF